MNGTPPPLLVMWRGDGCHLCDDAAELLGALVDERERAGLPVPAVEHRRIADDPAVERELFEQIPVLEMSGHRLLLATRLGPIRRFVEEHLDGLPAVSPPASGPGR